MKKSLLLCLLIVGMQHINVFAQDTLTVEQYMLERADILNALRSEADAAVAASMAEYEAFVFQHELEFSNFKDQMEQEWGSFKERDKSHWVEYIKGGKVRWEVDFENGEGMVEVLADENDNTDSLIADLENAIVELLASKGTETEMPDETEKEVLNEPVLNGQIDIPEDMDSLQFAKEVAQKAEIKEEQGDDGKIRRIAVLNLQLIPEALRIRAEKFRNYVENYSKQYELDPTLVLAIIHTESYFNPMAKSHANALGLMQIVPRTAGRDVYRVLNGKDAIPSPDYLYDPDKNVLFGSTYIDILMNRYMRGIEDKTVHEYLVICAYNTGAGNVARAYINSTNFSKARSKINSMSAQENYDYLLANLPWPETQDYLKKVSSRKAQYQEWMSAGK